VAYGYEGSRLHEQVVRQRARGHSAAIATAPIQLDLGPRGDFCTISKHRASANVRATDAADAPNATPPNSRHEEWNPLVVIASKLTSPTRSVGLLPPPTQHVRPKWVLEESLAAHECLI
jgi:hypothetical protein